MKKFKENILSRIRLITVFICLISFILLFNVMDIYGIINIRNIKNTYNATSISQIIILCIVELFLVYSLVKYITIILKKDLLDEYYIKENDEREQSLKLKTGGYVIDFCILMLIVIAYIASYFSVILFWGLIGGSLFLFIIKFILNVYFRKRM